ncbi:methylaspartate mutase [Kitasatospora sp. NPDC018058]|uniref:methylaspartate mutase n=1 Tax=Kitasatospora sp. NPDC018058 TaxID=3364025 RepID=UPI0037C042C3
MTPTGALPVTASFVARLRVARTRGEVMVQPRMGFADPVRMREGLLAVRAADAPTVGTLTLDSYTRTGDTEAAARALRDGTPLNGYPLCNHPLATTTAVLAGLSGPSGLPVQVRHGSARPVAIVERLLALGLDATEGGPVSYCLPYGRVPLRTAVDEWSRAADLLAAAATPQRPTHVESFGGCLLGQLCPPSLLVAVSVMEALFLRQHGVPSVSLSYAQQTHPGQDLEALVALRRLAGEHLPDTDTHLVLYTYMGVFPRTPGGAEALLAESARLAVHGGADRLIVKTTAESRRIPTIADNVHALELAAGAVRAAQEERGRGERPWERTESGLYDEARLLVEAVRSLHPDVGRALREAFRLGLLDLPYCLHPDTVGRASSRLDADGRLQWATVGAMPLPRPAATVTRPTAAELSTMLNYVATRFDGRHGDRG